MKNLKASSAVEQVPAGPRDDTDFFEPYGEFAKTLRTWFIAYGIGAPVLVLSNTTAWSAVKQVGNLPWIGSFFLVGVALQVVQAFIYKNAMWHLYVGELDPKHKESSWYKISDKISESFRLELFFDIGTFLLFVIATIMLVSALV